jgi:uncharacterized protein (DUF1778 family)
VSSALRETKTSRVVARISDRQKKLLEKAAAMEARSVASFLVAHGVERAEYVLREETVLRLNEEQSARFLEVISRKPRRAPATVQKAAKAYGDQVTEI